ncbi:MAG: histidine kinase [Gammaproteobacteria bacterium]|nr:histidine kinase [Gammaproteobacteria bacterium]
MFALVATTGLWRRLDDLALISLLVQWTALACTAVLCVLRRALLRLSEVGAATAAYLLILLVTAVVSEAAWWSVGGFDPERRLIAAEHGEFLFRNLSVCALVAAVALRYCYVQYHWQRQLQAELQARLQALQARIRPHFFFNCMNTIASLTRIRPAAAERAVEDLADLFRASLADARDLVPVGEEIALSRKYLDIEQLRLGERLRVEWEVADLPAACRLPALSLQPLVENAVYHGIEPRPGGGSLRVRGWTEAGRMLLEVCNPLPTPGAGQRPGNRVAQDNVRQRLAAHFGAAATLEVQVRSDEYRVRIAIPLQDGENRA